MLLHMAGHDAPLTSEQLSRCLGTNPVVVRRTMGLLRKAGIVSSEPGHAGGWRISADPSAITLRALHVALDEPKVFAIGHRNAAPGCLVERTVNAALDTALVEAEALLMRRMEAITLARLAEDLAPHRSDRGIEPEGGGRHVHGASAR